MADSFWTGGPSAYAKGIEGHYEAKLMGLNSQLQDCPDDARRQEIEHEISTAKAELKEKLGGTDSMLF